MLESSSALVIENYQFGPFRIDTAERLLHRGGEVVSLPPKVVLTLLVLVENGGRMVPKDDLIKAVWPDTFVEEGALARNISLLRKTLGDTGENPVYIETVPKRGYRFIAPLENGSGAKTGPLSPAKKAAGKSRYLLPAFLLIATAATFLILGMQMGYQAVPGPPPVMTGPALAVLPFRSIENDPQQAYFADGTTQALISSLASLGRFRVVSLVSDPGQRDTAAWNAILRDRSVRLVLSGAILRSGGRVRIDAQLMDPATRNVHWAKSYEREAGNVMALESEIATAIASEIQSNVTAQDGRHAAHPRPVKPEALDAYLRGRYYWNRRSEEALRRAVDHFQRAIALDPEYALAYTGLADSYSLLGSIGTDGMPPNEAMPLAKAAAAKALALEPDLADAHVSLAYVHLSYDWDLPAAEREFARALKLNPNSATGRHWYSHYFMASGDLAKATEQMREALRLEPLSPSINIGAGWCLYFSRRFPDAIERFRSVAELEPTLPLAHQTLGMAYQQNGQIDEAIEEYKRAAAFSNNSPASVAALATAYAAKHQTAEAALELARLQEMARSRYVPALYFASIYSATGDLSKAFAWGWKALGERCDYLMYLRVEPSAGKLRAHPEFLRVMGALRKR